MGQACLSTGVKFPELPKDTTQASASPGVAASPCPWGWQVWVAGVTSPDCSPLQRQVDGDVGECVQRHVASHSVLPEVGHSAWTHLDSDCRETYASQIPRVGMDFLHA